MAWASLLGLTRVSTGIQEVETPVKGVEHIFGSLQSIAAPEEGRIVYIIYITNPHLGFAVTSVKESWAVPAEPQMKHPKNIEKSTRTHERGSAVARQASDPDSGNECSKSLPRKHAFSICRLVVS